METEYRDIRSAADAESIRDDIESIYDGWYANDPRIDWEDFLSRLERYVPCDLGEDGDSSAIRRIKRIVRQLRDDA